MNEFSALEHKITSLVTLIKQLKEQNTKLQAENESLKAENSEVKAKNARLTEDKDKLAAKFEAIEGSVLKGNEEIKKLNQEKAATKSVVDELIQSIDAIVEIENQQ